MADIQLDEHLGYQGMFWRIQRLGWALLVMPPRSDFWAARGRFT